ncbi:MAG: c-type cytochrome [Actinomycetota bacterium]|nr:c-type cytochrome [Actinomycetota bacterium]
MTRACGVGAVLLLAVLVTAGSPTVASAARVQDAPRRYSQSEVEAGRRIFEAGCASCHGEGGEGGLGPDIRDAGAASAHFQLITGRMPLADPDAQAVRKEPAYSEAQIDQLIAYVASLGSGPAIPTVDLSGTNLSTGAELFIANCSPCHGATANGGATGRGSLAPSLHPSKPLIVAEAMITGPGQMPNFGFDAATRNQIIRYVRYLQTRPNPGGADLGGIGPVPEGFAGLAIGMGALVLIALFIGKERAHARGGIEP